MRRINKKLVLIIVTVVVFAVIVILYNALFASKQLQVSPGGENNVAGPIVIKANEKINPDSGTFNITPLISGNLQIVDNFIIYWPEQDGGFIKGARYIATFSDFKTESNKPLKTVDLDFEISESTDYDKLQKEVLDKYGVFETSFNPFLEKLPYKVDYKYKISYVINDDIKSSRDKNRSGIVALLGDKDNWREKRDNYTVFIETLLFQSPGQSLDSYINDVKRVRKEALDWIKDQGVDIDKDINYEFIPNDKTLQNPGSTSEEVPLFYDDY